MNNSIAYWTVIPAAGIGSRMLADIPKQYLEINGKTILEHTLERFTQHPSIRGITVAISEDDDYWSNLDISSDSSIIKAKGGTERCHSVLSGLTTLLNIGAKPEDWVLVHDAARPCLKSQDINRLISECANDSVGGILAVPVRDTMKRSGLDQKVIETVDREGLWHALTPQMFRLSDLKQALEIALEKNIVVTDEAQAMELMGFSPKLVEGSAENIKITRPQDLALADHYLDVMDQ